MASFVLFDGSTLARSLNAGEFRFIGQPGSLSVSGTAISSSGIVRSMQTNSSPVQKQLAISS